MINSWFYSEFNDKNKQKKSEWNIILTMNVEGKTEKENENKIMNGCWVL